MAKVDQGGNSVGDEFFKLEVDVRILGLFIEVCVQEVLGDFIQDRENFLLEGVEGIVDLGESCRGDQARVGLAGHILEDECYDVDEDLREGLVGEEEPHSDLSFVLRGVDVLLREFIDEKFDGFDPNAHRVGDLGEFRFLFIIKLTFFETLGEEE